MRRSAAAKTTDAADALLAWLHSQTSVAKTADPADADSDPPPGLPVAGASAPGSLSPELEDGQLPCECPNPGAGDEPAGVATTAGPAACGRNGAGSAVALAGAAAGTVEAEPAEDGRPTNANLDTSRLPLPLAHTDWLHHRLAVFGPDDTVAEFQAAAAGAGTVPWQLDLDTMTEDLFLQLVSPPPPQTRILRVAGARKLAAELRAAMARRHGLAVARVGHSRACPLDLHALLAVPEAILCRGPDDPTALAWLWRHWGTTQPLRHVEVFCDPVRRPGRPAVRYTFWSADWTPWPAFAALARRWPTLRFELRPTYGRL